VLLSVNVQSEHVATREMDQKYYRNINNLSLCRPMLPSGNVQSEYVAAGERIQSMIFSEH